MGISPILKPLIDEGSISKDELIFIVKTYFGTDDPLEIEKHMEKIYSSGIFLKYDIIDMGFPHRASRRRTYRLSRDEFNERYGLDVAIDIEMFMFHPASSHVLRSIPFEEVSVEKIYEIVEKWPLAKDILTLAIGSDGKEGILNPMRMFSGPPYVPNPRHPSLGDGELASTLDFREVLHKLMEAHILTVREDIDNNIYFYVIPEAHRAIKKWWIEQA